MFLQSFFFNFSDWFYDDAEKLYDVIMNKRKNKYLFPYFSKFYDDYFRLPHYPPSKKKREKKNLEILSVSFFLLSIFSF